MDDGFVPGFDDSEYDSSKCSCQAWPGGECDYCSDFNERYQKALKQHEQEKQARREQQQRDYHLFLDVTKRKTRCRGCGDSMIKGTPRVVHRENEEASNGNVYLQKKYYHLACWKKLPNLKQVGGARPFQSYGGFDVLPKEAQVKIMNGELHDTIVTTKTTPPSSPVKKKRRTGGVTIIFTSK